MTKVSDVMDCINLIETTCRVSDWRVNGLRIWPFARIRLSILIRDHDFVGPKVEPRFQRGPLSLLLGLSVSFINLLQLLLTPSSWQGFPALVLTKPSSVRKGFNIYSGPLQEQLRRHGQRHLIVEIADRPHRPRFGESVLLLDRYWLSAYVRVVYGLLRFFQRASTQLPGHGSACRLISGCFPALGRRILSRSSLIREATFLEAYKRTFGPLLDLARPSKIFIICYYSRLGMGTILAARGKQVVSADYQHGVQGKLHYAYGSWRDFPSLGYELLPDVFLNWSEAEKLAIDQWATATPHRSIVVGNLLTEHVLRGLANHPRKFDEALRSLGDKPKVLYSLQNFIPPEWIWDAIIATSMELKWLIRLHPQYPNLRKVVHEKLGNSASLEYELDLASRLPLPLLLSNIAVHVTGNSSVVLEALAAGKPSIVIDHYGREYYADLIAAGKVMAASDPQQLALGLKEVIARAPLLSSVGRSSALQDFLKTSPKPRVERH